MKRRGENRQEKDEEFANGCRNYICVFPVLRHDVKLSTEVGEALMYDTLSKRSSFYMHCGVKDTPLSNTMSWKALCDTQISTLDVRR